MIYLNILETLKQRKGMINRQNLTHFPECCEPTRESLIIQGMRKANVIVTQTRKMMLKGNIFPEVTKLASINASSGSQRPGSVTKL